MTPSPSYPASNHQHTVNTASSVAAPSHTHAPEGLEANFREHFTPRASLNTKDPFIMQAQ